MIMEVLAIRTRLVEARKRAGLSQGQVAVMLGLGGASSFTGYETGKTPLTLNHFLDLCSIYGISPVWALTGINPDFDANEVRKALRGASDDLGYLIDLLQSLHLEKTIDG